MQYLRLGSFQKVEWLAATGARETILAIPGLKYNLVNRDQAKMFLPGTDKTIVENNVTLLYIGQND